MRKTAKIILPVIAAGLLSAPIQGAEKTPKKPMVWVQYRCMDIRPSDAGGDCIALDNVEIKSGKIIINKDLLECEKAEIKINHDCEKSEKGFDLHEYSEK